MVSVSNPLCRIDGVFNGILVDANMVGEVMFYGPGAGKLPTASAVVADIIDIISSRDSEVKPIEWTEATSADLADFEEYTCKRVFIVSGDAISEELSAVAVKVVNADGKWACLTSDMSEKAAELLADKLGDSLCSVYRTL